MALELYREKPIETQRDESQTEGRQWRSMLDFETNSDLVQELIDGPACFLHPLQHLPLGFLRNVLAGIGPWVVIVEAGNGSEGSNIGRRLVEEIDREKRIRLLGDG